MLSFSSFLFNLSSQSRYCCIIFPCIQFFYVPFDQDITQQQLCEVQVAELLEKCTRFHIFCSARLCEEDMMSFDAKINNENLTKCLQTVKELYADLEKRKVFCQNEAEFRAYMALMNLNEGDTLR